MDDADDNKSSGHPSLQNAIGNESSLAAAMYEENPTSPNPDVPPVNNPMPIGSIMSEFLGNDSSVFQSSGNAPLSSIVSPQGNVPSTSSTFLISNKNGDVPNTSSNGNAPNSNGNAPLPPP